MLLKHSFFRGLSMVALVGCVATAMPVAAQA